MSLAVPVLAKILPARENVEKVIAGWKMSNDEANQLRWTFDNKHTIKNTKEWRAEIVRGLDRQWVLDLFEIQPEVLNFRADIRDWEIPVFPVTGNDLIAIGLKPGPVLGAVLKGLRNEWVESDYTLTKDQMVEMAREALDNG